MEMNLKHRIASGALALSLMAGTGAAVAAEQSINQVPRVGEAGVFAQTETDQDISLGQLISGLSLVNVGPVGINVGDINVEDLVVINEPLVVVDVTDTLNDNEIFVLNNILNNSPILSNNSDILTNVLQDANLITENQIVVGVLGGTFFVLDQ